MPDEPLIIRPFAGGEPLDVGRCTPSPASSRPETPAPGDRPSEPARSPLSVLELHLLTLRESVDRLTDEHALMLRILRAAKDEGALHLLGLTTDDPYVHIDDWAGPDLDPAEVIILGALLRADV